jgi:serine/threonine protein phosphatase PrpC
MPPPSPDDLLDDFNVIIVPRSKTGSKPSVPVLVRAGGPPDLPDLPTGALLGVGGVPFETTTFTLNPGDQLVLYSDGLVETCDGFIDERLDALLYLLSPPCPSAEETCDRLLQQLRQLAGHDEAALLIAHAQPLTAV